MRKKNQNYSNHRLSVSCAKSFVHLILKGKLFTTTPEKIIISLFNQLKGNLSFPLHRLQQS